MSKNMSEGQLDIHMQKMKLDRYLTPYTKLTQNESETLNTGAKTIKLLKEEVKKS